MRPIERPGLAPMRCWLPAPLDAEVEATLIRLRRGPDVARVAVMPDVHLAREVCVGVALATRTRLYPAAVGGDIGCGMAAIRVPRAMDDSDAIGGTGGIAGAIGDAILAGLRALVPIMHHPRGRVPDWPADLDPDGLSAGPLRALAAREGIRQLGTLGRGNHFAELQTHGGDLWLTVHSGSRGLGPAIGRWHRRDAPTDETGLAWLDADSPAGAAYLADLAWARAFARHSRARMLTAMAAVVAEVLGVEPALGSHIERDHNHVAREDHGEGRVWVHRKGAMAAAPEAVGVIPGSMGHASYHVTGRGGGEAAAALGSCSHGAGRAMSRSEARMRIDAARLSRQMGRVHFDRARAARLVEEAPAAYKDISAVMRAQAGLVRVVRRLEPVLSYKGG